MFRLQLGLLYIVLVQDAFSKSVKKHNKKQTIPRQHKSHYLLLMGQPVEDGQHHKGLGMILSSAHNEDAEKLKETSSSEDQAIDKAKHPDSISRPDLPASAVQNSPNSYPSNRDFSYTEALFTGTPLFNGKPSTSFDKPQGAQSHVSAPNTGHSAKENERNLEGYNNAGLMEPVNEETDDRNKQKESAQRQKEIHTEEGVTGIVINKNLQEGENHKVFQTMGHENEEKNSLNETPEKATERVDNQYFMPRLTLVGSPYKPHGETFENGNKEENHQPYRAGPLETDYKMLENLPSDDNIPPNVQGQSHSGRNGENVENQFPYKNYDEESNMLGSNAFGHGNLAHEHADHALDAEYQITGNMPKEEAVGKMNQDSDLSGINTNGKETNSGSQDESGKTSMGSSLDAEKVPRKGKESQTSPYKSPINKQTDVSSERSNKMPVNENQEQRQEQSSTYDAKQKANGNLNDSKTTSMASASLSQGTDQGIESLINQLRPHKIIESSFDEELTHGLITGPSYPQDGLGTLTKQSAEKTPTVAIRPNPYDFQPSSSYREGSNPSDFSRPNAMTTNNRQENSTQGSSYVSETTSPRPFDAMGKETTTEQDTPGEPSMDRQDNRLDHEQEPVHQVIFNHEHGYMVPSRERSEKEPQTHYESSENSIQPPPEYSSGQGETGTGTSSSYREGSNPSVFAPRNNHEQFNPNYKLDHYGSPSAVVDTSSSWKHRNNEESYQHQESYQASDNAFHGRPVQENRIPNNEGIMQESKEQRPSQKQEYKEIPPASPNRETGSSPILNPQHEESAKGQEGNSFEASSVVSEAVQTAPSKNYEKRPSTQKDKSDQTMMPESGVGTMPMDEKTVYPQHGKTLLSGTPTSYAPSNEPLRPGRPSLSEHEGRRPFRVGVPEQAEELATEFQPKGADNEQHKPERDNGVSEGRRNDQQDEKDRDNKNQKIVYFLKMAKGIPLLNNKPVHDQHREYKETYESGSHPTNEINEKENKDASAGEMGSEAISRIYRWRWKPRPSYRKPAPRPSRYPNRYPSPSPSPYPSPYPSPVTSPTSGENGGALGGSSVDSNVPQGDSDFEQEALNTHNKYRKTHGVAAMTLDRDLSNQAKAYAQKIANMGSLIHSSREERGQSVGENLAYACASNGTPLTGKSATKMWYDEVCKPGYNFASGGFSGGTGHFTQVVWKDSVKLGIGQGKATKNGMQCIYVVGRYEIAGNMQGEFQDQVLRGNFNQQYCNNV